MIKICKNCGRKFKTHRKNKIYCRPRCLQLKKYEWMKNTYRKTKAYKISDKKSKKKDLQTERGRRLLRKRIKKYSQSGKGRLTKAGIQRKYAILNPLKIKAQRLSKKQQMRERRCLICGKTNKLHFHHTDYKSNLGCTLCKKHHLEQHGVITFAIP